MNIMPANTLTEWIFMHPVETMLYILVAASLVAFGYELFADYPNISLCNLCFVCFGRC